MARTDLKAFLAELDLSLGLTPRARWERIRDGVAATVGLGPGVPTAKSHLLLEGVRIGGPDADATVVYRPEDLTALSISQELYSGLDAQLTGRTGLNAAATLGKLANVAQGFAMAIGPADATTFKRDRSIVVRSAARAALMQGLTGVVARQAVPAIVGNGVAHSMEINTRLVALARQGTWHPRPSVALADMTVAFIGGVLGNHPTDAEVNSEIRHMVRDGSGVVALDGLVKRVALRRGVTRERFGEAVTAMKKVTLEQLAEAYPRGWFGAASGQSDVTKAKTFGGAAATRVVATLAGPSAQRRPAAPVSSLG